jgi:hypothetical protein
MRHQIFYDIHFDRGEQTMPLISKMGVAGTNQENTGLVYIFIILRNILNIKKMTLTQQQTSK